MIRAVKSGNTRVIWFRLKCRGKELGSICPPFEQRLAGLRPSGNCGVARYQYSSGRGGIQWEGAEVIGLSQSEKTALKYGPYPVPSQATLGVLRDPPSNGGGSKKRGTRRWRPEPRQHWLSCLKRK